MNLNNKRTELKTQKELIEKSIDSIFELWKFHPGDEKAKDAANNLLCEYYRELSHTKELLRTINFKEAENVFKKSRII